MDGRIANKSLKYCRLYSVFEEDNSWSVFLLLKEYI